MRTRHIRDAMSVVEMSPEYVIRKGERYYLLPPFSKVLEGPVVDITDKRFGDFVAKHVNDYLRGEAIPLEIQAPIINAAEEFMAGKNLTFRAGDYIALQKHFNKEMK